ncbi:MAG: hypothetical protein ACTSU5_12885 [Promethearchaeota archaeon]
MAPASTETTGGKKKTILDDLDALDSGGSAPGGGKVWKAPSTKRIVTGGTLMTTMDVLSSLFFTVFMMQVSRASLEEASLVAVVDTFSAMLRIFATLGFVGAGAKFLAEYLARDKVEAEHYLISASKYNFIFTGFPVIAIAVVLYLVVPTTPKERGAYFLLVVITVFDRLRSCPDIVLIGYQRYDLYSWAFFIPYALSYVAAMVTFPLFGAYGALASFAISRVAMLVLSLAFAKKISDFPLSSLFAWNKEFGLFRKMVSFNLLYSLANLAFSLLTTTLLITLGKVWGVLRPQEIVALYTLSTSSNILINVFEIVAPIQQSISEAHSLRNHELVVNYTMVCVKFPIVMSVAVITFLLVFPQEIISILFGSRWTVIGVAVFATLPVAYMFGAFASRYDNILAGVGRPETVIVPWFIALGIAAIGLWLGRFIPGDVYLVDNLLDDGTGQLVNYGISLRFLYCVAILNGCLLVAGIWIVRICLVVLNVKIPAGFVWKPLLSAGITAAILVLVTRVLGFRDWFLGAVGLGSVGEVSYLVVVVILGVILFVAIGCAFDVLNAQDGLFWKSVVGHMGPLRVLMKPVFWFGRQCLKLSIPRFRSEPIQWVLETDRETLERGMLFRLECSTLGVEGDTLEFVPGGGKKPRISGRVVGLKGEYHNFVAYLKLDHRKLPEASLYEDHVSGDVNFDFTLEDVPAGVKPGLHELYLCVEMYDRFRDDARADRMLRGGLWKYFDYRLRWYAEERFFLRVAFSSPTRRGRT